MNLEFKEVKRKPTVINMAKINYKEAKEILKKGINGKSVNFSDEDIENIKKGKDNELAGFIATDGNSYWFINFEYAKKNYEI